MPGMFPDGPSRSPSRRSGSHAVLRVAVVLALLFTGLIAGRQIYAQPAGRSTAGLVDQAVATRAGSRADTIGALLARRAAALRVKDRAAFLDTADRADPANHNAQAVWFDNLVEVPFDSWTIALSDRSAGDVPPQAKSLAARLGSGTVAAPVDISYRVSNYDNAPQRYERVFTFTPRRGRWFVSGTFDPLGAPPHRELWDAGRVHVLAAEHGLILGLEPTEELRSYVVQIDREVPAVSAVWGRPWAGQVLVEVTRTEDEMATLLGGAPASYRQLAAVTRGELGTAEATSAADRVIVNPKAYGELSDIGRRVIMGHEITHVAARASTQSWTPRWLAEGLADYVGYRDSGLSTKVIAQELVSDLRRGLLPYELPDDSAFIATNPTLAQAYEMSWLACRMIADEYGGSDVLVAFYRAVGVPGGVSQLAKAFRDVLSTTPEAFAAQWRDYVQSALS
jgi:hypothetical protein